MRKVFALILLISVFCADGYSQAGRHGQYFDYDSTGQPLSPPASTFRVFFKTDGITVHPYYLTHSGSAIRIDSNAADINSWTVSYNPSYGYAFSDSTGVIRSIQIKDIGGDGSIRSEIEAASAVTSPGFLTISAENLGRVTQTSRVVLQRDSVILFCNGTVFQNNDIYGSSIFNTNKKKNVEIYGGSFVDLLGGANSYAFDIQGGSGSVVMNTIIKGFAHSGVFVRDTTTNNLIAYNHISKIGAASRNIGVGVFLIRGASYNQIFNNEVDSAGIAGVIVDNGSTLDTSLVLRGESNYNQIEGNYVRETPIGVRVEGSSYNTVANNVLINGTSTGIVVQNTQNRITPRLNRISGNYILYHNGDGIGLAGASQNVIQNNVIIGNNLGDSSATNVSGISLDWVRYAANSPLSGDVVDTIRSDSNSVRFNYIRDNRRYGIRITGLGTTNGKNTKNVIDQNEISDTNTIGGTTYTDLLDQGTGNIIGTNILSRSIVVRGDSVIANKITSSVNSNSNLVIDNGVGTAAWYNRGGITIDARVGDATNAIGGQFRWNGSNMLFYDSSHVSINSASTTDSTLRVQGSFRATGKAHFGSYLDIDSIAPPATPAYGGGRLFSEGVGGLFWKRPNGAVDTLAVPGVGGGGNILAINVAAPITTTGGTSPTIGIDTTTNDGATTLYQNSLKKDKSDSTAGTGYATVNKLNLKLAATDTASLSGRIDLKLSKTDTASLSTRINAKFATADTASLAKTDTTSLSTRINTKLATADTASLSTRINTKLAATDTASLSTRINALGIPRLRSNVNIQDDFFILQTVAVAQTGVIPGGLYSAQARWNIRPLGGTGTSTRFTYASESPAAADSSRQGIMALDVAPTATDGVAIGGWIDMGSQNGTGRQIIPSKIGWSLQGAVKTASTRDSLCLTMGFIDTTSTIDFTNSTCSGIYFQFGGKITGVTGISDSLYAVTSNGATGKTATYISDATSAAWHNLEIKRTSAGVEFYDNGSLVATHTTNLPTAAEFPIIGFWQYGKDANGVGKKMLVDYYDYLLTGVDR